MKVIDTIKKPGYCQWCGNFVRKIFTKINLLRDGESVKLVQITGADAEHIHVLVDDIPFIVRTWNHIPCEFDENHLCCAETITYSLFLPDPKYNGAYNGLSEYGTQLSGGVSIVRWTNDPQKREREVQRYNKLHNIE